LPRSRKEKHNEALNQALFRAVLLFWDFV